jgi:hypothetical protein
MIDPLRNPPRHRSGQVGNGSEVAVDPVNGRLRLRVEGGFALALGQLSFRFRQPLVAFKNDKSEANTNRDEEPGRNGSTANEHGGPQREQSRDYADVVLQTGERVTLSMACVSPSRLARRNGFRPTVPSAPRNSLNPTVGPYDELQENYVSHAQQVLPPIARDLVDEHVRLVRACMEGVGAGQSEIMAQLAEQGINVQVQFYGGPPPGTASGDQGS